MTLNMASVGHLLERFQREIGIITTTFREKGHQRFQKALLLSGVCVLGSYYLIYHPAHKKVAALERQILTARMTAENADSYKMVHDQLLENYSRLPNASGKSQFLTQAVIETLKAEGITSDSLQPPVESVQSNLAFQSIGVAAEVKFSAIVSWLARLEAARPFIRVTEFSMLKGKRPGICQFKADVGTIIPMGKAP